MTGTTAIAAIGLFVLCTLSYRPSAIGGICLSPNGFVGFEDTLNYNQQLLSGKALEVIDTKYSKLGQYVKRRSERMLARMEKSDTALRSEAQAKDSVQAKAVFADIGAKYASLRNNIGAPVAGNIANPLKEYIPGLDSLQSALRFLGGQGGAGLPGNKIQAIRALSQHIQQFQFTIFYGNAGGKGGC